MTLFFSMRIASAAATLIVVVALSRTPRIRLRNGVDMPYLAAGTWQYNDSEAEDSVIAAIKAGFTMIDTAHDYNNQVGVGKGIKRSGAERSSLFVQTKVPGCGLQGVSLLHCYKDTRSVLDSNLQLLGLTYVDLVIIHFPPAATFVLRTCRPVCEEVRGQWKALEEFYAAGKAKAIGVSNYCPSCFSCLDGVAKEYPMLNQVSYHIGMGDDAAGFRSFARSKGVVLQAYSPLGNTPAGTGPNKDIIGGNFTRALGRAHSKTTIQVALKYLVQKGIPIVTKSANPTHLAEDLDLWTWNLTNTELDEADKYRIPGMPSFACNFGGQFFV